MTKLLKPQFDKTVYLFQGGGALGAYQVGVYAGLCEQYPPDWVIGTSIGAINSAIIVGNAPEKRVKKLNDFWNSIATKMPSPPDTLNNLFMERWQHYISAQYSANVGQPGFYKPRKWNPWASMQSTPDKLSYYDTDELRETLLKHIEFDRINEGKIRLSVGAVKITSGQLVYFDNTKIPIQVEHIMASGALPPGFPAVEIDSEYYWDAGIHSNTQLNLLLCEREPTQYICFMVQLFDSFGTLPTHMDDVLKRQKDITYSSHHTQSIQVYRVLHNLRNAIRILGEHIPEEKKNDPVIKKLLAQGESGTIHVARFNYKGKLSDLSSKDYDFSLPSIDDHIKAGYDEVVRVLRQPPWMLPYSEDLGLFLYEFAGQPVYDGTPFEEINHYHRVTS